MNQNICANCGTPNVSGNTFCAGCGLSMGAPPSGYSANQPPPNYPGAPQPAQGFNPHQPNFSAHAPNQSPAPKKSRMGLWLAILGGVGFLILMIGALGIFGVYYFIRSAKQDINFNSSYPANMNQGNRLSPSNGNTSVFSSTPTVSMTENDKYRLFYAASKAGDQPLTMKISKKIGIIDDSGSPTEYYKTFTKGMFEWAMRDREFVKKLDTKQKALDYINAQMPTS